MVGRVTTRKVAGSRTWSLHPHHGVEPPPNQFPPMTTTRVLIVAGLSLGAYSFYRFQRAARHAKLMKEVEDILSHQDHLAEEMVETSPDVKAVWAHRLMVERTTAALARLERVNASMDQDDEIDEEPENSFGECGKAVVATLTPPNDEPTVAELTTALNRKGELVYADKPREVNNHCVLRSKRLYIAALLCETKNRFGVPDRTNANKLAVRKFALDRMTSHGLRPSHIHQVLPLVVELTFCKSESERQAAAYGEAAQQSFERGGVLNWIARACGWARPDDLGAF